MAIKREEKSLHLGAIRSYRGYQNKKQGQGKIKDKESRDGKES